MQLGWTLPFAWAGVWTLITIPWVQSDLRREKKAWAENRGQGGIHWVDDITAPTARTRFESVQGAIPSLFPWGREKQSAPSTPGADGLGGTTPEVRPGSSHEGKAGIEGTNGVNGVNGVNGADVNGVDVNGVDVNGVSKDAANSKDTADHVPDTSLDTGNIPDSNPPEPDHQQTK